MIAPTPEKLHPVSYRAVIWIAKLLLDEVDRLSGGEPEGRAGVSEVVESEERGEVRILECDGVPAFANIGAIQHQTFRAPEDQLCMPRSGSRRSCTSHPLLGIVALRRCCAGDYP